MIHPKPPDGDIRTMRMFSGGFSATIRLMSEQRVSLEPKASISAKIKRKGSDTWEDLGVLWTGDAQKVKGAIAKVSPNGKQPKSK